MSRKIFPWFPAIFLMTVIFVVSSTPSTDLPDFGLLDMLVKKGGHALGYSLLALSYVNGLQNAREKGHSFVWILWVAWLMAVLYAATDELHQSFTPGRHPSAWDVLIDACGAGMTLFVAYCFRKTKMTSSHG